MHKKPIMTAEEGQEITQMRITHLAAVITLYFGEVVPTAEDINKLSIAIIDVEVDDDRVLESLGFIEANNGELDYNAEGFDIESHLLKHLYISEADPQGNKPNVDTLQPYFNDKVTAKLRDKVWKTYTLENKPPKEKKSKPSTSKSKTTKPATKVINKDEAILIITSRGERRCRAGMVFTKEASEVVVADLEKGQLEALQNDPELIIK